MVKPICNQQPQTPLLLLTGIPISLNINELSTSETSNVFADFLHLIHKKGDPNLVGNFRLITSLTVEKPFHKILTQTLSFTTM